MGMLFLEMAMLERPEKFLQVIDKKRIVDEKVVEAITERYSPDVINLLRAILKIEPQERPRTLDMLQMAGVKKQVKAITSSQAFYNQMRLLLQQRIEFGLAEESELQEYEHVAGVDPCSQWTQAYILRVGGVNTQFSEPTPKKTKKKQVNIPCIDLNTADVNDPDFHY